MIDDVYDYCMGEGIYHKPYWDGHSHFVAGERFSSNDLLMAVRKILDQATLRIYLVEKEDVIIRYFICWYSVGLTDVPYRVFIDEVDMCRCFYYESISGEVVQFVLGNTVVPDRAYLEVQTSIEAEVSEDVFISFDICQMSGCEEKATCRHAVKVDLYLYVCDKHMEVIGKQLESASERKLFLAKNRKKRDYKKKLTKEEMLARVKLL